LVEAIRAPERDPLRMQRGAQRLRVPGGPRERDGLGAARLAAYPSGVVGVVELHAETAEDARAGAPVVVRQGLERLLQPPDQRVADAQDRHADATEAERRLGERRAIVAGDGERTRP